MTGSRLVQSYLDFIKQVLMEAHESYIILEGKISKVAIVQLVYLYVGKIGETIIMQYKDSQSACNMKNFEILLITYKQLILYIAEHFQALGAVALARYVAEMDQDDADILRLQLHCALEMVTADSVVRYAFQEVPDMERFWEECDAIKEGVKFTRFSHAYKAQLFQQLIQLAETKQEVVFTEDNIRNLMALALKLEPLDEYNGQILDLLVFLSVDYDRYTNTRYNESQLLTSTQTSLLPVTLAFDVQQLLEKFVLSKSEDFQMKAVGEIRESLHDLTSITTLKYLFRIVQEVFAAVSDEARQTIFEEFRSIESEFSQFEYGQMLAAHLSLFLFSRVQKSDDNKLWLSGFAKTVLQMSQECVVLKAHLIVVMVRLFFEQGDEAVLDQVLQLIQQQLIASLPSNDKPDVNQRVYSVMDFKFSQDSPDSGFEQLIYLVP